MHDFTITQIGDTPLQLHMPFKFIEAKGKSFLFQEDDLSGFQDEKSSDITFANDYYLCAYQTTQEFWEAVIKYSKIELEENPSYFKAKTRPVENVSWDDVQLFIHGLNGLLKNEKLVEAKNTIAKGAFSLPSETQWEFAALGNEKPEAKAIKNFMYTGSDHLNDVGWCRQNSNNQTMPVGLKQPNHNGLYDMSGNVWEWCQNDYRVIESNGEAGLNNKDTPKALRGGGYFDRAQGCRLRIRGSRTPDFRGRFNGFRLRFSPSSSL